MCNVKILVANGHAKGLMPRISRKVTYINFFPPNRYTNRHLDSNKNWIFLEKKKGKYNLWMISPLLIEKPLLLTFFTQ